MSWQGAKHQVSSEDSEEHAQNAESSCETRETSPTQTILKLASRLQPTSLLYGLPPHFLLLAVRGQTVHQR